MHRNVTVRLFALVVAALIATGFGPETADAEDCGQLVKSLNGDYEVLQADGGLWRFMEKSSRLRSDSMIGFQIDGKIKRAVYHLDELCSNGKEIPPEFVKGIQEHINEARTINNKSTDRTPAKQLLEMLTALNQNLTQFMEKNGL